MTSLLGERLTKYGPGCEGGCGLMEIICPNGLKDGMRPRLGDDAIGWGPRPKRGWDIIGPYSNYYK